MHCTKCACVKYHETKIVCPLWNVKIRLNFNFHMFSAGAGVFFPEPEFFLPEPEPEPEVKNPEFAQHYISAWSCESFSILSNSYWIILNYKFTICMLKSSMANWWSIVFFFPLSIILRFLTISISSVASTFLLTP